MCNLYQGHPSSPQCNDKIPKFRNKYSQKRNIGVSVPISTIMRLWAIYIFPRLVCLFCWRKYVDQSWDYINRSQTHECGNWGWGRAIPRKGIHKWDFRCSARHHQNVMKAKHMTERGHNRLVINILSSKKVQTLLCPAPVMIVVLSNVGGKCDAGTDRN